MLRFVRTRHGCFPPTIRNPNYFVLVSYLHTRTDAQYAAGDTAVGLDFGGASRRKDERRVGISRPWSEWVRVMELLSKRGYFVADGDPIDVGKMSPDDSNRIRTACLNFARDRFGLIRHLSRKDIRVIVECGCPSLDRKVVNSGKRLRAHFGVEERNVCESCNLRGNCQRAYMGAREDEGARTVDVMRILLTYGLDSIVSLVENKSLCGNKVVTESVRNLLNELVVYSSHDTESGLVSSRARKEQTSVSHEANKEASNKLGDWRCPKCNFLNFARNIRCLSCDSLNEGRLALLKEEDKEHLPLKKGDWICGTCNFMNFAKNTRCLRCREKPSARQINPGEWECESCNYINFRNNMACLKCDHKRPKASKHVETDTQPKDESFAKTHHENFKLESRSRQARSSNNMWRFVDENKEEHVPARSAYGLMDFPIEGGNSELSRSREKRENWKVEMLSKRQSNAAAMDVEKTKSAYDQRRLELLGSSDDEEIDEWFARDGKSRINGGKETDEETDDCLM